MKVESRRRRLGMIPPLELSHGFRTLLRGTLGRASSGAALAAPARRRSSRATSRSCSTQLRPWRRHMPERRHHGRGLVAGRVGGDVRRADRRRP